MTLKEYYAIKKEHLSTLASVAGFTLDYARREYGKLFDAQHKDKMLDDKYKKMK